MTSPASELGIRPLEQWKVTELKEELKRRKISTKGLKDDLIKRLEEALRNEDDENAKKESDLNEENDPVHESQAEDVVMDEPDQSELGTSIKNEKEVREMKEKSKEDQTIICNEEEMKAPTVESCGACIEEKSKPESSNQVSEKVNSPDIGSQVKCESVCTDSVSLNEENELKDSLNADNVNLESDILKNSNLQESSRYMSQQNVGVLESSEQLEAAAHSRDAEEDKGDGITENHLQHPGNENSSGQVEKTGEDIQSDGKPIKNDASFPCNVEEEEKSIKDVPHQCDEQNEEKSVEDARHPYASQSEEKLMGDAPPCDESENKSVEDEIPVVKSLREDDISEVMAVDVRQDVKENERAGNDVEAVSEKRKTEGQVAVEPAKRQRRWGSENVQPPSNTQMSLPASAPLSEQRPSPPKLATKSDPSKNRDENNQKEHIAPPSQRPPTTSLRIDRFVRPFTIKALHELLGKTGTVTAFWMDHIKTHCYVMYSSVEEAVKTRNAVYNLQWPPNGGNNLVAEFVDAEEAKRKIENPTPTATPRDNIPQFRAKPPISQGVPGPSQHAFPATSLPPPPPMAPSPRERQPQPSKNVEQPSVTLDDLFKKTKTSPRIYFLPLSDEEVSAKIAARKRTRGN